MSLMESTIAGWRQRRFPQEFRIAPVLSPPSPDEAPLEAPSPAAVPEAPSASVGGASAVPTADPGDLPDGAVARVATDLWRARRRVTGPQAAERPDRAARLAGKHLEGARDHLEAAGIEIHDHDGQPYVEGLELVVLAYEEDPAVTRPTIKETVRPTVRRAGQVIQQADVIVGVPVKSDDHEHGDHERGPDHA